MINHFILRCTPGGNYRVVQPSTRVGSYLVGYLCGKGVNSCLDYLDLPRGRHYRVWFEPHPEGEWKFLPGDELLVWKRTKWFLPLEVILGLEEAEVPPNTRLNVWLRPTHLAD